MKGEVKGALGQWLKDRCERERLSLRQAANKTGLSHATIGDVINGVKPSAETIRKLARAFGGNGQRVWALEDKLLVLAGYRSERPQEKLSEPVARLMDSLNQFDESQLKIMSRFADFLVKMEEQ